MKNHLPPGPATSALPINRVPLIQRHAGFVASEPEATPLLTRFAPMTIGTQALQVAKHEGIPVAFVWDDVIDLRGWNGPT